jgi:hypothetical protein
MPSITQTGINLPAPLTVDGKRAVTFVMVDEMHKKAEGTASRMFRKHRKRLIENGDYAFCLQEKDVKRFIPQNEVVRLTPTLQNRGRTNSPTLQNRDKAYAGGEETIVLFESGYLLLTKPFRDDLSWSVQRVLVEWYFRGQHGGALNVLPPARLEYLSAKLEPTIKDQIIAILAQEPQTATWELRQRLGVPLKRRAVYELREQNRRLKPMQKALTA